MAHRIIQPDGWKPAKGYANGVLTKSGTLYVGGQIGWTAEQVFEAHDFIGQMRQALTNIRTVVETAGGTCADIVRLTWYVTDKADYLAHQAEVGAVYREVLGRNFPAMTMVVIDALVEDEALLEIEATAEL
ncbi:Enamine deaminase RidA, house cleaning of reactive enamine intermediates, YjgF/YER057c/UK114 family [Pseudosulfitobacter pseudonitzschiae]|uniref:Endoribonuclease L-PSP n=1 Tax=Pseudosulfitobacter pseudonitzschiae TaxID=1402135 RepID=A0A073JDB1_9RHOB|nr:RidA family protein [Pseudosulfitobacter pseudonitzschiae]KEJ95712.1 endoribonuclease L-PSP [Pseudosulfitobacter pseudonitzschiae]QKS08347.1 RidA family protein [Pseudosulfitobacter pseudonitzschiae]SHF71108.1 Enamine deaminase RidA, house cleaning of reactive enamine intermediates, YjgF/YER057c/UK114 family [Pseudosulfitobacter pseudonitzschiae]